MKRVYIAGRLSNTASPEERTPTKVVTDYLQNVHEMCRMAGIVRGYGHAPFVPALDLLLGIVDGTFEEEDYREVGLAFLECCDAVLVISESPGVRKEIDRAHELGIPVYSKLSGLVLDIC